MDFLTWAIVISIGIYVLQGIEQRRRVRLLARYLMPTRVEKLMGHLIDGYLRALDEKDPQRQQQVWTVLDNTEKALVEQFQGFADNFAKENAADTRISTLPLALPYFDRLFAGYTLDMRAALQLHADAIRAACAPEGISGEERKRLAFIMTAELLLMQHTCHWFCKTRTVASMRLLARHKTSYEQVLQSVAPATRRTYQKLLGAIPNPKA